MLQRNTKPFSIPSRSARRTVLRVPEITPLASNASAPRLQTSPCACGGQCPRCSGSPAVQTKLAIGASNDHYEQEADRTARQIMRTPNAAVQRRPLKDDEPDVVQTKTVGEGAAHMAPPPMQANIQALRGGGRPLSSTERAFFEPRFGQEFGAVRVHSDARANETARALNAQAFTRGHDIALGPDTPALDSAAGRELLAHELTHVVQQRGAGERVQRRLTLGRERPADAEDPASQFATDDEYFAAFQPDMNTMIHTLCDRFSVDATSGEVVETGAGSGSCADPGVVASGPKPTGCCCLCTLASTSASDWTIRVTMLGGPRTRRGTHEIFIHPRTSPFEFGGWTAGGAIDVASQARVFGHEACGHAALMELNLHPAATGRIESTEHDPTVNIENVIATEQGAAPTRGLAASGPHRGESVTRMTISRYPLNGLWTSQLPADERGKIDLAATFIRRNNAWVDVLGHSDSTGSADAKLNVSAKRASIMRDTLVNKGVTANITKEFPTATPGVTRTVSGVRFTRVEGRSDFDLLPGRPDEQQRRVQIDMALFPAGAHIPIPTTPTGLTPAPPESAAAFARTLFFGNPCQQLLLRGAWF